MSANPVHHKRTKHIELDIHFLRERVQLGDLRVLHVPTGEQYVDIMTKGVPTSMFHEFRSSLCVVPMTQQTAGKQCVLLATSAVGQRPHVVFVR